MARGTVSRTTILDSEAAAALTPELQQGVPAGSMVLEHERIPFENYAYEWSPEMLWSWPKRLWIWISG
jgi:hypothetical protein